MRTPILHSPSRRPDRSHRRARPLVEGLEVRQVPTSLLSPTSLVLLNNSQPLLPGWSPTVVCYLPNSYVYHPPGPI